MAILTNPYQSPAPGDGGGDGDAAPRRGRPCRACGSARTTRDSSLRPRPSVWFVIFFGWVFLLVRGACARRAETCLDCGTVSRYKSVGSWVALAVLLLLGYLVWAAMQEVPYEIE